MLLPSRFSSTPVCLFLFFHFLSDFVGDSVLGLLKGFRFSRGFLIWFLPRQLSGTYFFFNGDFIRVSLQCLISFLFCFVF